MPAYRLLLFLIILSLNELVAQQELGMHFMRDVWQSSLTNPAFTPENKLTISLPGWYYDFYHTGAAYDDMILRNASGNLVFDAGLALKYLEDNNDLLSAYDIESFGIAFKQNNFTFSLAHTLKYNIFMAYPENMVKLAWEGNAQFIGEEVAFGPDLQIFSYHQIAAGAAYETDIFSIGARLKYLSGQADVSTDKSFASLYTSDDAYQLTFNNNYRINSSRYVQVNSLTDFAFDFGYLDKDFGSLWDGNRGVALDLGARLFLGENLELAASVIDIGKINWDEDVRNFTSEGTFFYEGLDIVPLFRGDSLTFEGTLDTLSEIFNFKETFNSYSTTLPTKFYLSALYHLNDKWSFGGMIFLENFRGKNFHAAAVNASCKVNKYLNVGAFYSLRNDSYDNLGLNLALRLGPVQLFGMTDNIVAAIDPFGSRNVNTRIGLNVLLGGE